MIKETAEVALEAGDSVEMGLRGRGRLGMNLGIGEHMGN